MAESKDSASAVKCRGATFTCPTCIKKVSVLELPLLVLATYTTRISYSKLKETIPAIARPHWSRSHATAQARVFPVVGLVVTKSTKSALVTPSEKINRYHLVPGFRENKQMKLFYQLSINSPLQEIDLPHIPLEVAHLRLDRKQNIHSSADSPLQAQQRVLFWTNPLFAQEPVEQWLWII